jgi:hypothetical protein
MPPTMLLFIVVVIGLPFMALGMFLGSALTILFLYRKEAVAFLRRIARRPD